MSETEAPVNTSNDFLFGSRGGVIAPMLPVYITTRQQGYRAAAVIAAMCELLPDEDLASSFAEVNRAVRNA